MSDIDAGRLRAIHDAITARAMPPVHDWSPARTADVDLRIDRDGAWFYGGSRIQREAMVRLFATVLRRDADGYSYLVTPKERLRIQVDDVPFLAVSFERQGKPDNQALVFTTNLGEQVIADQEHPIEVLYGAPGTDGLAEPRPYVLVRDALQALINRSTFIELVQLAQEHDGRTGVFSRGVFMPLDAP